MELPVGAQSLGDLRPTLLQNDTYSHLSCSFTSAINSKPCHTLGVTDGAQDVGPPDQVTLNFVPEQDWASGLLSSGPQAAPVYEGTEGP